MVITKCPKCGEPCQPTQIVCMKCASMLLDTSASTVSIRDPELLKLRRKREEQSQETVVSERKVSMFIRGIIEKLSFEEGTEIILGRTDLNNPGASRFDLTRYGALERGVSREHALLRFKDNQLTVSDMGSVNGTKLNSVKLQPNQFQVIRDNDELMLGRLTIVFRFETVAVRSPAEQEAGPETLPGLTLSPFHQPPPVDDKKIEPPLTS